MAHAASQIKKNKDVDINALEDEKEKKRKSRKQLRDQKKKIILRTHNYRSHCFKAVSHNIDFCILGYAEGCRGNREPSVVLWESGRLSVTDLISDQSTGCCCDLMKGLISQGPKTVYPDTELTHEEVKLLDPSGHLNQV
ncbi:hypothetical protein DPX16_15489 [Anabarilius grahami]|uniref:Uncharacterized protein n=1 Tax=Anabarilius grahami TaxID=495550 RepID=A0A3N0XXH6_ANAGA|nr:hypothetical protein DPX16_15489 [Anabarilius grahami]